MSDENAPRVVKPVRNQLSLQPMDLEALVPEDHPARGIWALEIRVSTTDPECRVMKMADGGYRPAYNVQLATDSSGFIIGADVTNRGVDQPHVVPMLDEIERRTHRTPREYLVDGGFVTLENIQVVSTAGPRRTLRCRCRGGPESTHTRRRTATRPRSLPGAAEWERRKPNRSMCSACWPSAPTRTCGDIERWTGVR